MESIPWFAREFTFGKPPGILVFFLERLSGTGLRIESKVNEVPEEWLIKQVNNKWSIKQHIGHLAEVDQIALKRIEEMLAGIPELSMENLKRYRSLSERDLRKSSLHPRLKIRINPVDLAFFDAAHDDHHLVKINEIVNQRFNSVL